MAIKMKLIALVLFFSALGDLDALAPINLCSNVNDMIFLPFIGNCSKYYVCMNNVAIERDCEAGFLFDANTQSCAYPDDAKCLPACTTALSSFCYDRTCTKYVLCFAGIPVIRECCDGLQYNAETDRCDFPQYVDCVDNMCTIFNDPRNITFLPSKASCDKYYVCMDGQALNQTCSNGLQFNPDCNCCDFPSNVNCTITALTRNIQPFSKAPPKTVTDVQCDKDDICFMPHTQPENYYFCVDGRCVVLECTPGLIFDPKLESCREQQYVI